MSDPGYTALEVRSYLPSGWNLLAGEGAWRAEEGTWTIAVQDIAEQEWPLEVSARDAESLGRIPALKSAIDRLYRHA